MSNECLLSMIEGYLSVKLGEGKFTIEHYVADSYTVELTREDVRIALLVELSNDKVFVRKAFLKDGELFSDDTEVRVIEKLGDFDNAFHDFVQWSKVIDSLLSSLTQTQRYVLMNYILQSENPWLYKLERPFNALPSIMIYGEDEPTPAAIAIFKLSSAYPAVLWGTLENKRFIVERMKEYDNADEIDSEFYEFVKKLGSGW